MYSIWQLKASAHSVMPGLQPPCVFPLPGSEQAPRESVPSAHGCQETYVTVLTAYIGMPDGVLNAGRSMVPSSSARARKIGSSESAYAESSPPRYRMTVSKNGAYLSCEHHVSACHPKTTMNAPGSHCSEYSARSDLQAGARKMCWRRQREPRQIRHKDPSTTSCRETRRRSDPTH